MANFSFLSFCPMAIAHPSTNQSQRCLTSVISRELVCQCGYSVVPPCSVCVCVGWVKTCRFPLPKISGVFSPPHRISVLSKGTDFVELHWTSPAISLPHRRIAYK